MSSNDIYCVYLTTYLGNKLPPKNPNFNITPTSYIGSSNLGKIKKGYRGSVVSKLYKEIWKQELKENPHLFEIQIISTHDTRPEATHKELQLQKMFNVIKSPDFINLAYASPNGYFGLSMSGVNHPMFGKNFPLIWRKNISLSLQGKKSSKESSIKKSITLLSKKLGKLPDKIKIEIVKRKDSGVSFKEIHNWLIELGFEISKSTLRVNYKNFKKEDYIVDDRFILPMKIRTELVVRRDSGISFKEIHNWLIDLGFKISYSALPNMYRKLILLNKK